MNEMHTFNMADIGLIIFDVDGTLVTTVSGGPFRQHCRDWQWLPGRLEKLHALHRQGKKLAIATNQGGIAQVYSQLCGQEEAMRMALLEMMEQAGVFEGERALQVCFTHPKATYMPEKYKVDDIMRKPGPGMLINLSAIYHIPLSQCLYVGDRSEDELAAYNAFMKFAWTEEFFR